MKRMSKTAYLLSWLIVPLALAATLTGLLWDDLYENDSAYIVPQAQGQDLVTLALAIPLLVISLVLSVRRSLRGRLLWLGIVGYFLYTYTSAAFLVSYNQFFLVYVALFSLSLFALITGLTSVDVESIAAHFSPRSPRKAIGIILFLLALGVAMLWLGEIVPALLSGKPPEILERSETTTLVIQAMDLGLVVPLGFTAGILLIRGRPWGYALTAVFLVKAMALTLAIMSMILFMYLNHQPMTWTELVFFSVVTVAVLILTVIFLGSLQKETAKNG